MKVPRHPPMTPPAAQGRPADVADAASRQEQRRATHPLDKGAASTAAMSASTAPRRDSLGPRPTTANALSPGASADPLPHGLSATVSWRSSTTVVDTPSSSVTDMAASTNTLVSPVSQAEAEHFEGLRSQVVSLLAEMGRLEDVRDGLDAAPKAQLAQLRPKLASAQEALQKDLEAQERLHLQARVTRSLVDHLKGQRKAADQNGNRERGRQLTHEIAVMNRFGLKLETHHDEIVERLVRHEVEVARLGEQIARLEAEAHGGADALYAQDLQWLKDKKDHVDGLVQHLEAQWEDANDAEDDELADQIDRQLADAVELSRQMKLLDKPAEDPAGEHPAKLARFRNQVEQAQWRQAAAESGEPAMRSAPRFIASSRQVRVRLERSVQDNQAALAKAVDAFVEAKSAIDRKLAAVAPKPQDKRQGVIAQERPPSQQAPDERD